MRIRARGGLPGRGGLNGKPGQGGDAGDRGSTPGTCRATGSGGAKGATGVSAQNKSRAADGINEGNRGRVRFVPYDDVAELFEVAR